MQANTALSAKIRGNDFDIQTIIFCNKEHKKFYLDSLLKCRHQDVYHKALCYCLGIEVNTRMYINRIYDFESGLIKTECINEGWLTSGSINIVRLAFNLYTDDMPTLYDLNNENEKNIESRKYTVSDLFCCEYARYFIEAVKIRYPEYTKVVGMIC